MQPLLTILIGLLLRWFYRGPQPLSVHIQYLIFKPLYLQLPKICLRHPLISPKNCKNWMIFLFKNPNSNFFFFFPTDIVVLTESAFFFIKKIFSIKFCCSLSKLEIWRKKFWNFTIYLTWLYNDACFPLSNLSLLIKVLKFFFVTFLIIFVKWF